MQMARVMALTGSTSCSGDGEDLLPQNTREHDCSNNLDIIVIESTCTRMQAGACWSACSLFFCHQSCFHDSVQLVRSFDAGLFQSLDYFRKLVRVLERNFRVW
ncbi:hypothetical protein O6H91_20G046200 [Diphasiastrum complanatum]|uniref:Uncharacterized protein n=1 Tax=Diphasiastrum complanatum TaxID=34168 RepID=A0ACC2APS9_DIPCM|nr:hypothetical protein O6H91_20G046200 [Diphasiastrum complanatum]